MAAEKNLWEETRIGRRALAHAGELLLDLGVFFS